MSNNWKYANLGQRERLDLIRNGNTEVYNAEKSRNKNLKSLRQSLGLSTDEIDNWDKIIDNAKNGTTKVKRKKIGGSLSSKLINERVDQLNGEYRRYVGELKDNLESSAEDAVNDAEKDREYLNEWLINNGYSKDGNVAQKSKKELAYELETFLSDLFYSYETKAEKAKSDLFEKVKKLI